MKKIYDTYFNVNKETWNNKVNIHANSEFYDVAAFLKGKSSLNAHELNEIGNVKGKTLLHLQCHFGQDTLSFERLGAQCTGIDLSDKGIEKAKELNKILGLNTQFIETNVYDVPTAVQGTFDIVFASYGVIGWLPDLTTWGKIIASKLNKGGFFYLIEFHPIAWMYSYLETPPKLVYPYKSNEVIYEEYSGTYANKDASITSKEYGWNHGLGEVISALASAGLHIDFLHEIEKSPYNIFPEMEKTNDGMYVLKEQQRLFPLLFSIKATKK